eukprot:COSAG01_NODE_34331_length_549_cov_1.453333_1_plen_136_part_10
MVLAQGSLKTLGLTEDVRRWRAQRQLEAGLVVREEIDHVETEDERKRAKQQAQERLWDLFHAMDTDQSGSLDSNEIKLLTTQLGKRMTRVELAGAIREMDTSVRLALRYPLFALSSQVADAWCACQGDGEVDFGEF